MDWMTIFERFGSLGIAIAYFCRKEIQWEAERAQIQAKYEALLKEATTLGGELRANMDHLSEIIQKCAGGGKK